MQKYVSAFVLSLLFALVYTISLATYTMTEEELTGLEWRLTTLANDNKILQNQQRQSIEDLQTAKTALQQLESERATLMQQLTASRAEVARLKQSSSEMSDSLRRAEDYSNGYERAIKSRDRKIKILQYILLAGGVYIAAKG